MKSVIVFDPDKCCACSACAVACMDQNDIDVQAREESYRMAKLLRAGNRELARQLNLKKARR